MEVTAVLSATLKDSFVVHKSIAEFDSSTVVDLPALVENGTCCDWRVYERAHTRPFSVNYSKIQAKLSALDTVVA